MPLRKRKGRRRPKLPPSSEAKDTNPSEENAEKEGDEEEVEGETAAAQERDASMDEEERRARETIAQLAKKYQVSSVTHRHSLAIYLLCRA